MGSTRPKVISTPSERTLAMMRSSDGVRAENATILPHQLEDRRAPCPILCPIVGSREGSTMATLVNIGQPVAHIEGPDKVTGRTRYTADLAPPGMLWGKCLRSPHPHARIVRVDASRARAVVGVHAVVTAADLP